MTMSTSTTGCAPRRLRAALAAAALGISAAAGAAAAEPFAERFTFHAAPAPLAEGAVTEEWPRFLGPRDDATSRESPLLRDWPDGGPKVVWELEKGNGYASPAIVGERLVYFHRLEDEETVDCFHPETGAHHWTFAYPITYTDRYGYNNGPRASPVVDEAASRVYTFGVTAVLHCLDLATGEVVWKRDLPADYAVPQGFFGSGPTPIVHGDLLIQNVGGRSPPDQGACVVAFDKATGEERWVHRDAWGASYASPVIATLRDRPVLLVFAGGESSPPSGGLIALDPRTGELFDRFPWRADKRDSVNASTPVVIPGTNRILISETYSHGGVLLELDESMKLAAVWEAPRLRNHWITPVVDETCVYSFTGRNPPDASLGAFALDDGRRLWDKTLTWTETIGGFPRTLSFFRGSLLAADGGFLALGEFGTLAWLDLTPEGVATAARTQLFHAQETWALPAIHRGLLFISQHGKDAVTKAAPRLIAYDLRGAESE